MDLQLAVQIQQWQRPLDSCATCPEAHQKCLSAKQPASLRAALPSFCLSALTPQKQKLETHAHAHTHTHMCIYIYIVHICICIYISIYTLDNYFRTGLFFPIVFQLFGVLKPT